MAIGTFGVVLEVKTKGNAFLHKVVSTKRSKTPECIGESMREGLREGLLECLRASSPPVLVIEFVAISLPAITLSTCVTAFLTCGLFEHTS
jgi:hypothetical protein